MRADGCDNAGFKLVCSNGDVTGDELICRGSEKAAPGWPWSWWYGPVNGDEPIWYASGRGRVPEVGVGCIEFI